MQPFSVLSDFHVNLINITDVASIILGGGVFYCLSSFHVLQFKTLTSYTAERKFSVTYKFRTSPN